jgi:hypothetical protein
LAAISLRRFAPLAGLPRPAQWGVLLAGSFAIAAALEAMRLPAALLLGPMIAAILVETGGGAIRLARLPRYGCQAVIGLMIARALTPAIIGTFLKEWPLFVGLMLTIIAASSALGWALTRWRILPGTTGIWGLSPGAASAMVLMAEAFGADARLVAFMQYLRVVFVAIVAMLVARFWVHVHGTGVAIAWFPALHAGPFAETLLIALVGAVAGRFLPIPAGMFLVPMIAGSVLHATGLVTIELPPWLLAVSYTFLGWSVGLGFTREIFAHAIRTLPQIAASIFTLILFCAGVAWVLVKAFGVDPLTAYLATSPGGMDSVAIIAASTKVDISFVMAFQISRFVILLSVGPALSRFVARQISRGPSPVAVTSPIPLMLADDEMEETLAHVKEDEGELD